ncbi:MAG TPA: tetratricopeptide repeat protein, partial [Verrucomicrobiae bacterium]|nr:tetratricopeptide repeat protein [Verrucomicrobiae bacterium]
MISILPADTTTEEQAPRQRSFAACALPWVIAAGGLALYMATLSHWVNLANWWQVKEITGWDWPASVYSPLHYLVTYPIRWLPGGWQPLTLNLFAAVCAGLTLALLARSVALLPHDRTHEQRQREHSEFSLLTIRAAWMPPVFAAVVCGLQLSFWENATNATGEMFDLLLFAYLIRCLLEYRIDRQDSWMTRFALIYGLAMADNWAMIGFFPAFLMALIWTKGLSFFNPGFLLRTFGLGLAGFSVVLLLPLIRSLSEIPYASFWQLLHYSLAGEKHALLAYPRKMFLLFGLTSLLPVFVMAIRWSSYFGDSSPLGVALATISFHVVHAVFLGACVWMALDPTISPRFIGGYPFLPLYYLGALSVGYFSGYFLLVFGTAAVKPRRQQQPTAPWLRLINVGATTAVWLLFLASPVLLFSKNLPHIRVNSGAVLDQYVSLIRQSLPQKGAIILSDDPVRLFLLEASLRRGGSHTDHVLLNTYSLASGTNYHLFLEKKYPQIKAEIAAIDASATYPTAPISLIRLLARLAKTRDIYYLHPSFGYYFEQFRVQPHGLAYQLTSYTTNDITAPPPSAGELAENQAFWKQADASALDSVAQAISHSQKKGSGLLDRIAKKAHLGREMDRDPITAGFYYSRALDYWGVELQKSGQLREAATYFTRALDMNPDNVAAGVNHEFNQSLQKGKKGGIEFASGLEDKFGRHRTWEQALGQDGPFDEPDFCFHQAILMATNGLARQAIEQLERSRALATNSEYASLILAQIFLQGGRYTNALAAAEDVLRFTNHEPGALFIKSASLIQMRDYAGSISPLNELLVAQTNNYSALLNRAIAHLQLGQLDSAQADYEAVEKLAPKPFLDVHGFQVTYG